MRMTAADELEEAGFHVLEANADIALKVLEARSDEVQVLFTDVDMPGSMDGLTSPSTSTALAACAAADLLRLCPSASRRDPGPWAIHAETLRAATLVGHIHDLMRTLRP